MPTGVGSGGSPEAHHDSAAERQFQKIWFPTVACLSEPIGNVEPCTLQGQPYHADTMACPQCIAATIMRRGGAHQRAWEWGKATTSWGDNSMPVLGRQLHKPKAATLRYGQTTHLCAPQHDSAFHNIIK